MDEIDAALDFKNVSIVGHYVKYRTKDAQFIITSLWNNMFELADRLVGIYKTDNCTKSITINPGRFVVCEQMIWKLLLISLSISRLEINSYRDKSIMAISSWNDNGQSQFVHDPWKLTISLLVI